MITERGSSAMSARMLPGGPDGAPGPSAVGAAAPEDQRDHGEQGHERAGQHGLGQVGPAVLAAQEELQPVPDDPPEQRIEHGSLTTPWRGRAPARPSGTAATRSR